MGLSRRQFTKEFKLAAIQRLVMGASVAEVARVFEINPNVKAGRQASGSFPYEFSEARGNLSTDEGAITHDRALPDREDEFPAGYSLPGCAPAEPASASPAGAHLAGKRLRSTMQLQRTGRSQLTVCHTPGDDHVKLFPPKFDLLLIHGLLLSWP